MRLQNELFLPSNAESIVPAVIGEPALAAVLLADEFFSDVHRHTGLHKAFADGPLEMVKGQLLAIDVLDFASELVDRSIFAMGRCCRVGCTPK